MAEINMPKNTQVPALEAATNPSMDRPYNSKTFRIRGVPLAWELRKLQNFLENSSSDTQLRVRSLAVEINKRTQTATATFMKVSQQLQNGKECNIPISSDGPIEDDCLKLDDGFAGITTLYNPPPDRHNIDVVAISGIGGHAFGSFKERGGNYMWLRDALPKDIPTARIITYGYKSTVAGSTSIQNLEDLATSFYNSLLPLARSETPRPIIFIGHSLGGLIVKQALTILSKSQREADTKLVQAVYGIVFFGVPNHGMDTTSLISMAGDGPNRFLVESINFHNSQILDILHRDFQTALGKQGESEIVCFYETEESPTAKQDDGGKWKMDGKKALLVSKNSATNCRSWEIGAEHICSIARTHSNMVKFGRHDEEYETVCERIRDLCQRARICQKTPTANSQACFYVPFLPNPRFVGRTDILDNLRTIFFDKGYQKAALIGLGGVGKTQIALQFAFWVKKHKPSYSVLWLPVLSKASFEQACIEIIKQCAIQITDAEDPKESVRSYLSSKDAGKWLLIVDNADDIEVLLEPGDCSRGIYDYFPYSDGGLILFTTRSREVAVSVANSAVETVLEMSLEEATKYLEFSLINKALIKDNQAVTDLLEAVTCLPLAITQAAAYMNVNDCIITEYLRLFSLTDQNMIELMSREFYDDTRYKGTKNAVATTWLVSFRQIRKINKFAAKLLSFMAWIESRDIPQSILPQASEQQLTQAIGTLLGYGFLSRRSDRKTYDMHSLVQLATRVWIKKEEEMERTFRDVVSHLLRVFPSDEWENRELWRRYLPHAIRVLETRNIAGDEGCQLGYWVGRCLNVDKRAREAVRLLEHVVGIREKTLAEDHLDRLASQHVLAGAYQANGQVKEAVKLLEHVVGIEEKTLAEDHPSRLASQHELARAYQANGQIKEAVKLLEHVVGIKEKTLAEDHPNRLASQHELARAYQANGQVKEAVKLLEHVVGIEEKTSAEDHPDRLASENLLLCIRETNAQAVKDLS